MSGDLTLLSKWGCNSGDLTLPSKWGYDNNEPEFEVEVVFKSKQLKEQEREYLVKWKGYHPIEASWVNESDMEHAQKTIKKFHTRPAKKKCIT